MPGLLKAAANSGSYLGRWCTSTNREPLTLAQLWQRGFHIMEWDGWMPTALTDNRNQVIVMLAGRPKDPSWDGVIADASFQLLAARQAYVERGEGIDHRRGRYETYSCGVSYGGGQRVSFMILLFIWLYLIHTSGNRGQNEITLNSFTLYKFRNIYI